MKVLVRNEYSCAVVWAFFGIAFLWDWNENWPFPVLWPLLSFLNCWHIECSTFTASSLGFEIAQLEFHHLHWKHHYKQTFRLEVLNKTIFDFGNGNIQIWSLEQLQQWGNIMTTQTLGKGCGKCLGSWWHHCATDCWGTSDLSCEQNALLAKK